MYTVNITFKVDHQVFDEWLLWMQNTWIPLVTSLNGKGETSLSKLLGHDDEGGVTLVFQLFLPSRGLLNSYLEIRQSKLHNLIAEKWGEDVLFFQTVLERI